MDTNTQIEIPALEYEVLDAALPAVIEQEEVYVPPPLTRDEETFALAVVECGGNITAAYKMTFGQDVKFPLASGKALLATPGVAAKVKELMDANKEQDLVSASAHLDQLAKIRDLAILLQNPKTALNAERARGEVVGLYQRHDVNKHTGGNQAVQININMASKHDVDI